MFQFFDNIKDLSELTREYYTKNNCDGMFDNSINHNDSSMWSCVNLL